MTDRQKAIAFVERQLSKVEKSIRFAKTKPGVTGKEIEDLEEKQSILNFIAEAVDHYW